MAHCLAKTCISDVAITSAHNAQVPKQSMQMRLLQKRKKVNNFRLGTGRVDVELEA